MKKGQKRKKLTDLQKKAAALFFDHPCITELAPLVGVHRCTLWRWRKLPAFQKEIDRQTDLRIKQKRQETIRQLKAEKAALHKTPEYRRKRQRAYDARRKLKKLEEKLSNASSYREWRQLWEQYQRCYNQAYFDGMNPTQYLDKLQKNHENSYDKKKAKKEPKYIFVFKD